MSIGGARWSVACGLAVVAALSARARAQEEAEAGVPEAPAPRWRLDARPGVWFLSPAGKLRMPASPALGQGDELELKDLNLDSPRAAPFAEVELKRGRWGVDIGALAFSASDRGFDPEAPVRLGDLPLTPGQRVQSSLDFASLSVAGTYRFHEWHHRAEDGGWPLRSTMDAGLGARFYDVDFEFTSDAGREQADDFFFEPVVGIKWMLDIGEPFTVGVRASGGIGPWGDRSSWSFDILPSFEWRPITHVGVEIGYRLLVTDLSSGDGAEEFEWRGSSAGVIFAVTLRF